jgi:uncharacterized protein YjaZ
MSLMDLVKKWKDNKSATSQKFKEMQEDDRLQTMLEERKKSSNQRELESYYRRLQEDDIKAKLEKIRKKQTKESWKGKQMFNGKCTILKNGKSVLSNDNSILKQSNSFISSNGGFA